MASSNPTKLQELCESEGVELEDLLVNALSDSVVRGICMTPGCSYTTDVEPDQKEGHCEVCGKNAVTSCLILAGIL